MNRFGHIGVVLTVVGAMFGTLPANGPLAMAASKGEWEIVASVPLPGKPARFDYQSLDTRTGLLYIAGLGRNRLVVVDTRNRRVRADLPGFPHAHGVLAVPRRHRVYVTTAPEGHSRNGHLPTSPEGLRPIGHLAVVDSDTFRTVAILPTGVHPDGLDFDPATGRLFVSNEWGESLTVIEPRPDRPEETIPLGGEVGNTRRDPGTGKILSLVQSKDALVVIDPFSLRVVRRIPLPCRWPHSLWIIARPHRAFVTCEKDARLLSVNLDNGRVSSPLSTGESPDVMSWDPKGKRLFVASESGVVSVYQEKRGTLSEISRRFLGKQAHTILFDPRSRLLYLPLENVGGKPILRILRWRE
ncbi:MAG: YncE family protein [Nitrospirae bacterium]|nr:YncE family protein [Nitrospirota bacterium]